MLRLGVDHPMRAITLQRESVAPIAESRRRSRMHKAIIPGLLARRHRDCAHDVVWVTAQHGVKVGLQFPCF